MKPHNKRVNLLLRSKIPVLLNNNNRLSLNNSNKTSLVNSNRSLNNNKLDKMLPTRRRTRRERTRTRIRVVLNEVIYSLSIYDSFLLN
jgi:hypothetical protein